MNTLEELEGAIKKIAVSGEVNIVKARKIEEAFNAYSETQSKMTKVDLEAGSATGNPEAPEPIVINVPEGAPGESTNGPVEEPQK